MGTPKSTECVPPFNCACDDRYRLACEGAVFYGEYGGKRFCIFHHPDSSKATNFDIALKDRLDNGHLNFSGFVFPSSASFKNRVFKLRADFQGAQFEAGADFDGAKFFDVANFIAANFKKTALFNEVVFDEAALFSEAVFEEETVPQFTRATFKTLAEFKGTVLGSGADFSFTGFEAEAWFESAIFGKRDEPSAVKFESATFSEDVHFKAATFHAEANFSETRFGTTQEDSADFSNVCFDKVAQFQKAVFAGDIQFTETTFKDLTDFSSAVFKSKIGFYNVTFNSHVQLGDARFTGPVDFGSARFLPSPQTKVAVKFDRAVFSDKANFHGARCDRDGSLVELSFQGASFEQDADFTEAELTGKARYVFAVFKGPAYFRKTVFASGVDFSFAVFEKPERVFFHSLALRPSYFINVDARKFNFTGVNWERNIRQEMELLGGPLYRLLSVAYRHLAVNAAEDHRYKQASKFRFAAMDVRRLEQWHGWNLFSLDWWYWLVSGYGERVWRAALALAVSIAVFGVAYIYVGFANPESALQPTKVSITAESPGQLTITPAASRPDANGRRLASWHQAIVYSLEVSLLQKPEPKPLTLAAHVSVALQTVLGPLFAALLALAVRRKYMQ